MHRPPRRPSSAVEQRAQKKRDAEAYAQAYLPLARALREWMEQHPGANPIVQFNYLKRMLVIADIPTAIKMHYVTVNEDGRAMVEAADEATGWQASVQMLRACLELLDELAPPSMRCPSCNRPALRYTVARDPGENSAEVKMEVGRCIVICGACMAVNTLTDDGRQLRSMSAEELAAIDPASTAGQLLASLREHRCPPKTDLPSP